jgi:TolB-like protein
MTLAERWKLIDELRRRNVLRAGAANLVVLPFAFLGPESDGSYFADAMTDELIGRLGRIKDVRIKSRRGQRGSRALHR